MTISKDLFLAILSMDAYNRGYDAGVSDGDENDSDGLGGIGSQIGGATVINQSNVAANSDAVNAGFYAIAYDWNGETVISYRGTNDYSSWYTANDIFSGWAVGAGIVSSTTYAPGAQGQLALDFYEAVTGQNPLATEGGNAILTGHSPGGGLAGAIAGNC